MSGPLRFDALADLLRRPELGRLLAVLDRDGEEARVVGGAVRNALIGRPVHEVDVTTTALPAEVTRRAEAAGLKAVPTGLDHGTVTVVVGREPFEVTTLREDVETFGRHATVRFGRDFRADALRRDFTINALSVGRDGRVHDAAHGLDDLAARRVRFIGDPLARIREDYLRILRFFRFQADYGEGPLDPAGFHAAIVARGGLAILSRERIRAETLKLLVARRAVEVVGLMADAGFWTRLAGGVAERGRLARVVEAEAEEGLPPDPVRRLAALAVRTIEDADRLRESLRLSNAEHGRLLAYARLLARLESRADPLGVRDIRRLVAEHGVEAVADVVAATDGEPRPRLDEDARAALRRFVRGGEAVPAMPLRGADLLARGIPPGPGLGRLMAEARALWLVDGCPTDPEAAGRLLAAVLPEPDASR